MARKSQFKNLLDKLAAGKLCEIERKVLDALLNAPKGLTRRELIWIVFAVEARSDLSNDPYDRKIRKAIESLRKRLIPIISSSGKPVIAWIPVRK